MNRGVIAIVSVVLFCVSCGGDDRRSVLVMTASSLADAFTEVEAAFERANPSIDVELNIAGSSALREQIFEGAPGDVFASANEQVMQAVQSAGDATSAQVFARNELALAYPEENPAGVTSLADLSNDDLFVGLCAQGVPCGDAAREALRLAGVEVTQDTNEGDVGSLVAKLAEAELDAGIVYATDVQSTPGVAGQLLPAGVNVDIAYPIAALTSRGEARPADVDAFVNFVLSEAGQAILADHGFSAP